MNSPCENRHWNIGRLSRPIWGTPSCLPRESLCWLHLSCPDYFCLALEPSLLVALCLWQLMFVAGQPVKLPNWRELVSRDSEETGRLGRERRLFLFLCPGVIAWKGTALGIFPASSRCHCLWGKKCSLPSPPHFPFPSETDGNKIKSSITPFSIKNALVFKLWILMALKESTRGAPNAIRQQGSKEGNQQSTDATNRDNASRVEGRFSFLCSRKPATCIPTQGFSHLSETDFYVWLDSLPRICSEISLGLLESWTSINETHSRPLPGCLATLFKSVACVLQYLRTWWCLIWDLAETG